jgi:hypothetical protein
LREKLEKEHWGEYITIHPVNGDYAVTPTHRAAVEEMRRKYSGVAFFTFRIGYQAVVHFGGSGVVDGSIMTKDFVKIRSPYENPSDGKAKENNQAT